tara:strand:+ start:309 stop:1586 length:1278 start_codon:yes stop_codon:yes gene_type:complete
MTVNKGLASLIDTDPSLSNQAQENAINDIKAVDKDDGHSFILSEFVLDTAIHNNTVLTTSQKNDVLDTIYNAQPHLQIGRYLSDTIRHTNTILDGSIMPFDPAVETKTFTFIEALQTVDALQTTIPSLYGVTASSKGRGVNDHFGLLNNMFTTSEDSSEPKFTRLKSIMQLIDTTSRANTVSGLNLAISNAAVANYNLRTFLAGIRDDSTDFQTTLDNRVNSIVSMYSTLNTRISQIPGDPTVELIAIRNSIVQQQTLENSNIISLRTYIESVTDNDTLAQLAENKDMRKLLTKVSQNTSWQNYYNDYEANKSRLNPVYAVTTDSDKSSVIDLVLQSRGLPDVSDYLDFAAVANKTKRDERIDTKNFDFYTDEQIITKSCEQLGIITANRSIEDQSNSLLNNMNDNDRTIVANELDQNEDVETLS